MIIYLIGKKEEEFIRQVQINGVLNMAQSVLSLKNKQGHGAGGREGWREGVRQGSSITPLHGYLSKRQAVKGFGRSSHTSPFCVSRL